MDVQVFDVLPHGMTVLGHGLSPERLGLSDSGALYNSRYRSSRIPSLEED